jgi:hypothetical protein
MRRCFTDVIISADKRPVLVCVKRQDQYLFVVIGASPTVQPELCRQIDLPHPLGGPVL